MPCPAESLRKSHQSLERSSSQTTPPRNRRQHSGLLSWGRCYWGGWGSEGELTGLRLSCWQRSLLPTRPRIPPTHDLPGLARHPPLKSDFFSDSHSFLPPVKGPACLRLGALLLPHMPTINLHPKLHLADQGRRTPSSPTRKHHLRKVLTGNTPCSLAYLFPEPKYPLPGLLIRGTVSCHLPWGGGEWKQSYHFLKHLLAFMLFTDEPQLVTPWLWIPPSDCNCSRWNPWWPPGCYTLTIDLLQEQPPSLRRGKQKLREWMNRFQTFSLVYKCSLLSHQEVLIKYEQYYFLLFTFLYH